MGQCPVAPEGVLMIRLEWEENLARRASNEGERGAWVVPRDLGRYSRGRRGLSRGAVCLSVAALIAVLRPFARFGYGPAPARVCDYG